MNKYNVWIPTRNTEPDYAWRRVTIEAMKIDISETGQTLFYIKGGELIAVAPIEALIVKQ